MSTPSTIKIEKSVSEVIEELAGQGATHGVKYFGSMAEALVFAALVGKKYDQKLPISTARENPIDFDIFQRNNLDSYIYLLGVSDADDVDVLRDDNIAQCFRIFEEYAHGGLKVISGWMATRGDGLLESILSEMATVAAAEATAEKKHEGGPVIITKRKRKLDLNKA